MQRIFGAIAIFAGWMTIPVGVAVALVVSEFFGLGHTEGKPAVVTIYGISGLIALWIFVAAALLTAIPLASAMVAIDPRRKLLLMAVAFSIAGVALTPDPLGRAFGLPLLAGAACLVIGGELVYREGPMSAGDANGDAAGAANGAANGDPAGPPPAAEKPSVGRGRRASKSRRGTTARVCPWCSSEVAVGIGTCPNCGATLDAPAADEILIPGLTEVPPNLQRYIREARGSKKRQSLLSMILGDESIPTAVDPPSPSDAAALRPPSPELKAEMARLDAEIAAGATSPGEVDSASPAEAPGASPDEPPETPPVR